MVTISAETSGFYDWPGLLTLLRSSYAFMDGRIDPPSSLRHLNARGLEEKSEDERLVLAKDGEILIGCCFLKPACDLFYVGKVAVSPTHQGQGIGRKLITHAIGLARQEGRKGLELQTRIELVENHKAFAAMGFRKTGESSHEGYDRPTSITMRLTF